MINLNSPYTSSLPFISFINNDEEKDKYNYQWDIFEKEYSVKSTYFKLITSFNSFVLKTRNFHRNQSLFLKIHLEKMKKMRIFLEKTYFSMKNKENIKKIIIFQLKTLYKYSITSLKQQTRLKTKVLSIKSMKKNEKLKKQALIKKNHFKILFLNAIKGIKARRLSKIYKFYNNSLLIKRLFKIFYMKHNCPILVNNYIVKKAFLNILYNTKYLQKIRIISWRVRRVTTENLVSCLKNRFFNRILLDLTIKRNIKQGKYNQYKSNTSLVFKTMKKYSYMKYKTRILKDTVYMKISSLIVYFVSKYYKKSFIYKINKSKNDSDQRIKTYNYKAFLKKTLFLMKTMKKLGFLKENFRKTCVLLRKKHFFLNFLKKINFSIRKTTQNQLSFQIHNYFLIKKSIKTLIAYFKRKNHVFKQSLLAGYHYFSKKVRILFRIFKENQVKNKKFRVFKEEVQRKRKEKLFELMIPYIYSSCIEKCMYNERIEKENYLKKNQKVYSICKKFINKLRISQFSKQKQYILSQEKINKQTKKEGNSIINNIKNEEESIVFNPFLQKSNEIIYKNLIYLKSIREKKREKPKRLEEILKV